MEIDRLVVEGVVVIAPAGHLDSKTSPELEALIVDRLAEGSRRFLIDFSAVETISSAALRVLLMFSRKLKAVDGSVALTSFNPHVKQVFDISGFTGSFRIVESRAAGLEALAPAANPAEELGRRGARVLGAKTSGPGVRSRSEVPGAAAATAARALQLLRRAETERDLGSTTHESPTEDDREAVPDDPLLEVSGGGSTTSYADAPTVSDLWRRLRRRLGVE